MHLKIAHCITLLPVHKLQYIHVPCPYGQKLPLRGVFGKGLEVYDEKLNTQLKVKLLMLIIFILW